VFNNDGVQDTTGLFEVSGTDDIILRAGQAAAESAGTGDDLHIAAADALAMYADDFTLTTSASDIDSLLLRSTNGGIQLSTGSTPLGSIRMLSSGTLSLETSETNADILLLPGTGSVGIGTTTPANKLHLYNDSGTNDEVSLMIEATATEVWDLIELQAVSQVGIGFTTTSFDDWKIYNNYGGFDIRNVTDNATAINIDNNVTNNLLALTGGNVGISDTGPDALLDVTGTSEQLRLVYDSEDAYLAQFAVDSSGDFTLTTSSGDTSLRAPNNNDIILRAGDGASDSAANNNDIFLAAEDSFILNAGDYTLTASEDATYPIILNATAGGIQLYSSGTLTLDSSANNTDILLLPGTGNVGIGTTNPSSLLEVSNNPSSYYFRTSGSTVSFLSSNASTTAFTTNLTGSAPLIADFQDNGTTVLAIANGGSVGIGTNSPGGILDVVGDEDIMLRAGLGASEYNLAGNNDLWLAAEDRIEMYASGFTLETSSTSAGELLLRSDGSLRLDTSANNTNIMLQAGTGNIDLSGDTILLDAGTGTLTLSSEGTITIGAGTLVLSNLNTCSGLSNGGALTTDASGVVSCSADDSGGGGAFTDGGTYIYPTNSARRFIYSYEGIQTTNAFFEAIGDEDIILRAGLGASEYSGSGNDDLHIAAQDALTMYAGDYTLTVSEDTTYPIILNATSGGIQLSTESVDNGNLTLYSAGTLTLDSSINNTNILMLPGTGNVGIGDTSPDATLDITDTTEQLRLSYETGDSNFTSFTVGSSGDITIAPSGNDIQVTGNLNVSTSLQENGTSLDSKYELQGSKTTRLFPEYPGAIITADGSNNTGVMTSDIEVEPGATDDYYYNYYEWVTSQETLQDYDIYVKWHVPDNFNGFSLPSLP
jgi:hypothetical protein